MTLRGMTWASWGLLAVWLSLSSVAFLDHIHFWEDNSSQDEAALAEFAEGLKSDVSPSEELAIHSVTAAVPAEDLVSSPSGLCQPVLASLCRPTTLRPHQQVSVYRI